jgi:hypothetical protein
MVFGLPISPLVFSIAVLPLAFRIVPLLIPGWDTFESYSLWNPAEMNQRPGQAREDVTSRWVNVGYWKVHQSRHGADNVQETDDYAVAAQCTPAA